MSVVSQCTSGWLLGTRRRVESQGCGALLQGKTPRQMESYAGRSGGGGGMTQGVPEGGNECYMDGHVSWIKLDKAAHLQILKAYDQMKFRAISGAAWFIY